MTGDVQGVFFRETCRREAQARDVTGWVRNNGDGTVEAVFAGSAESVEALVAWCHQGPPAARVSSVEVHEEEPEGLDGFHVT